jgi:hypothetical protein
VDKGYISQSSSNEWLFSSLPGSSLGNSSNISNISVNMRSIPNDDGVLSLDDTFKDGGNNPTRQ